MSKNKILIIGGYGQVGRYVTLDLVAVFPNEVIVAGRNLEKADAFAQEHNNLFGTQKIDIYDVSNFKEATKNVKVVVMCMMPKNNDFTKFCIENEIHYVDISPSDNVMGKIEQFKGYFENKQVACVLGVGLAPGLSNLLVKKLQSEVDILQSVDMFLMLGLGEAHGADGVNWLLDNIRNSFPVNNQKIKPFVNGKKTIFIQHLGKRKAYPFNIADQFIVSKTLQIENAASYLCFDSKTATRLLSTLKHMGVFNLLKFKAVQNIFANIFNSLLPIIQKSRFGTDIYSIKIDAIGLKNNNKYKCSIGTIGYDNSLLTAQITAFVAKQLYTKNLPSGIFYLEELFSLDDLNNAGICPEIEICIG